MYHHIWKHWRINLYPKGIKSDYVNFILLKERFFCHLSIGLPSATNKKIPDSLHQYETARDYSCKIISDNNRIIPQTSPSVPHAVWRREPHPDNRNRYRATAHNLH